MTRRRGHQPGCGCCAWSAYATQTYYDTRDARARHRESSRPVGRAAAAWQLEDDEYTALFPPILFRDVLVGLAGTWTA